MTRVHAIPLILLLGMALGASPASAEDGEPAADDNPPGQLPPEQPPLDAPGPDPSGNATAQGGAQPANPSAVGSNLLSALGVPDPGDAISVGNPGIEANCRYVQVQPSLNDPYSIVRVDPDGCLRSSFHQLTGWT